MAGLVDTEEVEVVDGLELTTGDTVDGVLRKFLGLELGSTAIVQVVDDKLATVPVADPVCGEKQLASGGLLHACHRHHQGQGGSYQGHQPKSGR